MSPTFILAGVLAAQVPSAPPTPIPSEQFEAARAKARAAFKPILVYGYDSV